MDRVIERSQEIGGGGTSLFKEEVTENVPE